MTPSALFYRSMPVLGMLLIFCLPITNAQSYTPPSMVSDGTVEPRATGKINIVAVMVEFQEDDNRFTSGNGTFYLPYLDRKDIIIDPLPHNRPYFEAHLEFVQNYYEKVSNGLLEIEYTVLPTVYRLDEEMAAYSPMGEDGSENYKLAHFARDTWEKASSDFETAGYEEDRTMFIIFHAGAGRDLELLGTSLNKTPQDIPSVFLGTDALGRLLDDPGFQGFPSGDDGFRITNTAILPQTESRPGVDITGEEFVLQLSINGLLTATIGSFIGLPDLFNTETGASGIGRFGLMDGASIFSYLGMFPPEPSAWEKVYMGWQEPFDIELDAGSEIELPAAVLRRPGSIARHRISRDEYFLIENRHRDPDQSGVTLTIQKPGGEERESVTIPNDDTRFDPFNSAEYIEILPAGTVVDVSNFDWSLPGGLDIGQDGEAGTEDDRDLTGGILIWHIDEAVIRRRVDDNTINNDPRRRGVALVEADGARDIGRPVEGLDGARFSQGHAFDFWWAGNDFTVITGSRDSIIVYENRFARDTSPSNQSNTGSPSFFEFFDFSDNNPVATFRARRDSAEWFHEKVISGDLGETSGIYNTAAYASGWPLALSLYETGSDTVLIVPSPASVYGIGVSENAPRFFDFNHPRPHQPFIDDYLIITQNTAIPGSEVPSRAWDLNNFQWEQVWSNPDVTETKGLPASQNGDTLDFDLTADRLLQNSGAISETLTEPRQRSESVNGLFSTLYENRITVSDGTILSLNTEQRSSNRLYTGFINLSSGPAFFLLSDSGLDIIEPGKSAAYPWIRDTGLGWPALVDFQKNGQPDIIYVDKGRNELAGRNLTGAVLDHFPLAPPSGARFMGTPLIADISGDGEMEILISVQDSISLTIHGYNSSLRPLPDFPLYVGSVEDAGSSPIHPVLSDKTLFAVSHNGDVKAWTFPDAGESRWAGQYGNGRLNRISSHIEQTAGPPADFGLLNRSETYNWPNPADDETFVRFETRDAARITITVINMSGATIYETTAETSGGLPQEIRLSTSSWGSGVYYCRVKASVNGQTETELIKILVIH